MTARSRLVSTWIAIAAILLNALVPTVSLAFGPAGNQLSSTSGGWIEICTTQGSSWIQLSPDDQVWTQTTQRPEGAPAATHDGHCPYCLTHAASFGLPPVPTMVLPVWLPVANLLPQSEPPVACARVWLVPVARAPPAAI